jgi:excisionase family DNA binding protein
VERQVSDDHCCAQKQAGPFPFHRWIAGPVNNDAADTPAVTAEPKRVNVVVPGENKEGSPRLAFTIQETANILGVSSKTVYRLIERVLLKSSKALRHKLIPRTEIERFLKETVE